MIIGDMELQTLKDKKEEQEIKLNTDINDYAVGLRDGLECAIAFLEMRTPNYRKSLEEKGGVI